MDSPGRSGAKFFVSFDKKFVIKSITGEEVALLHQILQPYHAVSIIIITNIIYYSNTCTLYAVHVQNQVCNLHVHVKGLLSHQRQREGM